MANNESIEWVPFSLTYVEYPKDDILGKFLAFVSLTPFGVIAAFVALCVINRDLQTIFFFVGQLSNETMNVVLKNIIKEKRPTELILIGARRPKTYGMPSQHTQFMAFFTIYCCLFLILKYKKSKWLRLIALFISISALLTVTYSRIYLVYHTWLQCVVGLLVGSIYASFWFCIVNYWIEPNYFDLIVKWKPSKLIELQNKPSESELSKKKR
ncbi:dolichyldiphosphatase 1-like protein [Leptotrombidium deliense]|uniref:Dolichyldiphosphatase n=1 Tax=Leptotrombidium deliense TaxID=299467 RepID=A0A443SIU1_9ACAR|nr:dolichyldiphosphatase 1-like protein [Leptotrombidium deliense]